MRNAIAVRVAPAAGSITWGTHRSLAAWSYHSRRLARVLGVLGQVVVAPVGDALELVPAPGEEVLDVRRARTSSATTRRRHGPGGAASRPACRGPGTTGSRSLHQYSYHCCASAGGTKYSISICSNSRVRNTNWPGVISLRKDLPTWAMPNGGRTLVVSMHVLEVDEHALGRLGAQVGDGARRPRPGRPGS